MADTGSDKRRGGRISYHQIIRVRQITPSGKKTWDVCTIKNASKTGILFYSSLNYETSSKVEVKISNPTLPREIACHATVARCFPLAEINNMHMRGVALEFVDMSPQDKEAFESMIELFLKKKKKKEEDT